MSLYAPGQYSGPLQPTPDYWDQFDRHLDDPNAGANTGVNGGANLGSLATAPLPPMVSNADQRPAMALNPQMAANPAPGASATGKGDPEGFRAAWFASGGKTVEDLKAFVAAHPEFGATITGSKGSKLTFPGGQAFQAVRSAGLGGGIGPAWDDISGGEGGAGGQYGFGGPGSFVTPMSEFQDPTTQDYMNDPGMQFALADTWRRNENGAAAKGTLLNGRFQEALNASNIGNALQGVQGIYDRKANTFGINYGVKTGNQDRPFSKYYQLATLGQQATSQS